MRISDWSSDVCSSDLLQFDPFPLPRTLPPVRFPGRSPLSASPDERSEDPGPTATPPKRSRQNRSAAPGPSDLRCAEPAPGIDPEAGMTTERSEEHTSELQSLMRNSYAVFCLKTKQTTTDTN